jgi:hypothetical protein
VTRSARHAVALAAAAASTLLAGCGPDAGLDPELIAASAVRVRADGCGPRTELGTGTAIGDGLVITAAHVLAGSDSVELIDAAGTATTATVVYFDADLDVAALRPATPIGTVAPLRTAPGEPGDRGLVALVSTDGSVELIEVELLQRVTIRTTDIYQNSPVERSGLRVALAVEPGDSGAMVHLDDGGVGIVWSRSTATADQAWTVDLPDDLLDAATRRSLVAPVDSGRCR